MHAHYTAGAEARTPVAGRAGVAAVGNSNPFRSPITAVEGASIPPGAEPSRSHSNLPRIPPAVPTMSC
jgi:hypothetical protein